MIKFKKSVLFVKSLCLKIDMALDMGKQSSATCSLLLSYTLHQIVSYKKQIKFQKGTFVQPHLVSQLMPRKLVGK